MMMTGGSGPKMGPAEELGINSLDPILAQLAISPACLGMQGSGIKQGFRDRSSAVATLDE